MRRRTTSNLIPLESASQEAFFDYVRLRAQNDERYENVFSIENGKHLFGDAQRRARMMNALKRRGLMVGVPDICVAVPTFKLHRCDCGKTAVVMDSPGMFMEGKRQGGKRQGGKLSVAQINVHRQLRAVGYTVTVFYGTEEAIAILERYFSGTELMGGIEDEQYL